MASATAFKGQANMAGRSLLITFRTHKSQAIWLLSVLALATLCVSSVTSSKLEHISNSDHDHSLHKDLDRLKRQSENEPLDGAAEGESSGEQEPEVEAEGKKKGGVSLGKVLGVMFLICCIIYCIGIGWKVHKICKGTYVEEEPVFLKYK